MYRYGSLLLHPAWDSLTFYMCRIHTCLFVSVIFGKFSVTISLNILFVPFFLSPSLLRIMYRLVCLVMSHGSLSLC